jgi:predicted flap endonuclease-1-like 5' DNA nuclease
MAYIPVERDTANTGLAGVHQFLGLQQELQQNALRSKLLESRLQTEAIEREASQFNLDEDKAMAPFNRVLKQLETNFMGSKAHTASVEAAGAHTRAVQEDVMHGKKLDLINAQIGESDQQRLGMQKDRENKQDEINSIKMLGPAFAQQAEKLGVNIPTQAREYLGTVLGQNILSKYVEMKQSNEALKMRGAELQMAHQKMMDPTMTPKDMMEFVRGVGQVARDNAPLLSAMMERVTDPSIKAILGGAIQGARQNMKMDDVMEEKIKAALDGDDPTLRDAALNVQSIMKGGNVRAQPVYDAAGNPVMDKTTNPLTGEIEEKPRTISAAQLLKPSFEKLLGPITSKKVAKANGAVPQAAQFKGKATGVVMDDLAELGADKGTQKKVSDFLGQFRLTKSRADLEKAAGMIDAMPPEQRSIVEAEIQKIMTGN